MAITIFDNWGDNRYEDAKSWLMEQQSEYLDEGEEPIEPSDEEIWEEVRFQEEQDWEDADYEMKKFFDGETVILRGSIGRWNGTSHGFNHGDFVDMRRFLLEDCDYITLEDSRGHFEISGVHHDGRVYGEIRLLTDAGIQAIEDWEYGERFTNLDESEFFNKIWNSRHFCRIPHFAKKVWSSKEVA